MKTRTVAFFDIEHSEPSTPSRRERLCLDEAQERFGLYTRSRGRFGYPAAGAPLVNRPGALPAADLETALELFLTDYEERLASIERSGTPLVSAITVRDQRVSQVADARLQSLNLRRDAAVHSGWGGLVGRAFNSLQPDADTQRLLTQVSTARTLAAITGYRDALRAIRQEVAAAQPPPGPGFRRAHQALQTLVDVATAAAEAQHRQLELNLAVPDHLPKNREVQRLAREISQAERELERWQEQQQWEMVKFAEVVARVMQGTPGMARSLRMPLAVEQALLGLSAGE
jgi:hypothetical protein